MDNDGDLDLIENNINSPSKIIINESKGNYLKINLHYNTYNPNGIGSQIVVTTNSNKKHKTSVSPVRSYLSTMDMEKIIGLGTDSAAQVSIRWPNNTWQDLVLHAANQNIHIAYDKTKSYSKQVDNSSVEHLFTLGDTLHHRENALADIHDFSVQPLLFKSCISDHLRVAHLNTNEYLIANLDQHLKTWNKTTNTYKNILPLEDYIVSDLFVKNLDLNSSEIFVTVVSNAKNKASQLIVMNNNQSDYTIQNIDLPKNIYKIQSTDTGIWLYASAQADTYPNIVGAPLYKLNKVDNKYELLPQEIELSSGIKDMKFVDLDGDNKKELITVNEWDSPHIFTLHEDGFIKVSTPLLDKLKGFWQTIESVDIDNDGDQDLVLGNLGTNSRLVANEDAPIRIVKSDLDNNQKVDPIMSYFIKADQAEYTYSSRDDITKVVPKVKKKYQSYSDFAKADFEDVIAVSDSKVDFLEINLLESIILENTGNMQFKKKVLPREAQHSLVNKFLMKDLNKDNLIDIIVLANYDQVEVHNGSLDGSNGLILINKGGTNFESLNASESGLFVSEPMQDIIEVENNDFIISASHSIYEFKVNY